MLARIRAAGVDPDQPWENVMPAVSARVHRALQGYSTLRDVVIAATDDFINLRNLHNFGRGSLRELWALLEALALYGMDSVCRTGPDAPLTTIDELVTWVLESAAERDRRLLIRRYLEGATLKELGQEEGVSGNTVRIWVCRALRFARIRVGDVARELMAPLIEALAESDGVLSRDVACKLASTDDLRRICIAAEIVCIDLRIQRDESLRMADQKPMAPTAKILPFPRRTDR